MAVDDVSFMNVLGEEVSRSNLVQQMIDFYNLKLQVGETRVTDFNEGSEIRNLLESIAVDVYNIMEEDDSVARIAFIETADAEWLDKHGANPFVNLPRNQGEVATGYVTFTIPSAQASDVTIPGGTIVSSVDTGLQYMTLIDTIIPVGDTSILASVECLTVGVDGNAESGTVTVIDDDTVDIPGLTVSNSEAFTGGEDYEEDVDYRERLLAFLRKDDFGSLPYYTNLGESVDGVHDVLLVDATGYTKKVLVNGNTKPTPNTVLADVLEEYTNVENIVIGHTFTVDKPDYVTKNLTVNLDVNVELDDDDLEEFVRAIFDGGDALVGYTFDGLGIGQGIIKNELYENFLLIEYIDSVEIIDGSTTSEITDLTVDDDEVLKIGTVTINQTVEE